jgi:hypothetical protein
MVPLWPGLDPPLKGQPLLLLEAAMCLIRPVRWLGKVIAAIALLVASLASSDARVPHTAEPVAAATRRPNRVFGLTAARISCLVKFE